MLSTDSSPGWKEIKVLDYFRNIIIIIMISIFQFLSLWLEIPQCVNVPTR